VDRPATGEAPRRAEVAGWCLFDFANSSFTTLITTVAFSVYFREAVVGAADPRGDLFWAIAGIVVNVVVILTAPVFGAVADFSGRKKRFLLLTVVQTVLGTALLGLIGPGQIAAAVVLYVIASVGFEGGYVFYNAFLPEVSTPKTIGTISSLAWGVGFLGGLAALVACIPFLGRPLTDAGGTLDPAAAADYRSSFLVVAAFFALFATPTLLLLRERRTGRQALRPLAYAAAGFRRVGDTLRHLREYKQTARYVAAFVLFSGGITTVIRFSAIYASQTFGIKGMQLLILFVATNLIAVPGTICAGWLADRCGAKATLAGTLVLWVGVVLLGATAQGKLAFWLMASGAAIGMGSTQSVGRTLMAKLTPPERESEFFGFYVLAAQAGSILAALTFGIVSVLGDQRSAVLWTVPFFAAGLALLLTVRVGQPFAPGAPDAPPESA